MTSKEVVKTQTKPHHNSTLVVLSIPCTKMASLANTGQVVYYEGINH